MKSDQHEQTICKEMQRAYMGVNNSCIIEFLDTTIDKLTGSSEDPFVFFVLTLNNYFAAGNILSTTPLVKFLCLQILRYSDDNNVPMVRVSSTQLTLIRLCSSKPKLYPLLREMLKELIRVKIDCAYYRIWVMLLVCGLFLRAQQLLWLII
jgi:hypothetical protein